MVVSKDNYKIVCACGCGETLDKFNKWGYERIFKHNHHLRGERNNHWIGGRYSKGDGGYILIRKPNHPFNAGYIREHRLIWENEHNACLLEWADVHHKDGDKQNNVWYNLQGSTKPRHTKIHTNEYREKIISKRICVLCGSNKSYRKSRKWFEWYFLHKDKTKPICRNCYARIRYIPKKKVSGVIYH